MYINVKLDPEFAEEFSRLCEEHGEKLAELNGFGEKQLNYTDFIDNFVDKAVVADASIDGNANVGHKDIVSLEYEMAKPHSKLLSFNKIFCEMRKKYGLKTARDWLHEEWDGHFYLHDAYNSTFKSYCYAADIEKVVERGLFFIPGFNCQPPKHLITFTDFAAEFISWACNRQSGAVGVPSFLVYSYWFWKRDVENGYCQSTPEYYRDQEFQRIIYKLNQPFLRGGIQSAFTNFTIFDREYLISLFGGKEYPDGTLVLDCIAEILEYEKAFMNVLGMIRETNMMTFPVITFALLRQSGKFADEDFARWCCRHNMKWSDANFYISEDVTSLSNCCRLVSDIKTLGFFNSIGGTALEVGSVKVNTINLARIAYENSREDYIAALRRETVLCLKALDCVRHIISRNVEKGLLPNYTLGILNMKSQYNTIGIIGIYEALQKYGYTVTDVFGYTHYTDDGMAFAKEILAVLHEVKDAFPADYLINIEQIPGERAAHILMQKDMLFFPDERYELPLYGNQWIPLGVKTTIQDKVTLSAELDKACNGGSIAHINLDKPFENFNTAWKILNYVADSGVVYFAFNVRISACAHNHGFYGDICPVCGGKKTTTYQRIVGFLTPETTYSKPRKEEFALRDWFDLSVMGDME